MKTKTNPVNLPEGRHPAIVRSGKFGCHRRDKGLEGIELILDVTGPDKATYEIVYFTVYDSTADLSETFADGEDFLTSLDPSELVGRRCVARIRHTPWLPGRPWVEATFVLPANER